MCVSFLYLCSVGSVETLLPSPMVGEIVSFRFFHACNTYMYFPYHTVLVFSGSMFFSFFVHICRTPL